MDAQVGRSQRGTSSLVVPLVLTSSFLIIALLFGIWAFAQMLDYKNNANNKIAIAVANAKVAEDKVKDAAFAEAEKQPLSTYHGPTDYGSLSLSYPKTWSAYIADTRRSSPFVDGYFYPNAVPDIQSSASVYALRVQIVQEDYASVISQFTANVKRGVTTVAPFAAVKVPTVVGVRVTGTLASNKQGDMIVLPLRNTTLEVWTEAPQFEQDFNTNILPNISFIP